MKLGGLLTETLSSLLPPRPPDHHVSNYMSPSTPKFVSGLTRTKRKQNINRHCKRERETLLSPPAKQAEINNRLVLYLITSPLRPHPGRKAIKEEPGDSSSSLAGGQQGRQGESWADPSRRRGQPVYGRGRPQVGSVLPAREGGPTWSISRKSALAVLQSSAESAHQIPSEVCKSSPPWSRRRPECRFQTMCD